MARAVRRRLATIGRTDTLPRRPAFDGTGFGRAPVRGSFRVRPRRLFRWKAAAITVRA